MKLFVAFLLTASCVFAGSHTQAAEEKLALGIGAVMNCGEIRERGYDLNTADSPLDHALAHWLLGFWTGKAADWHSLTNDDIISQSLRSCEGLPDNTSIAQAVSRHVLIPNL